MKKRFLAVLLLAVLLLPGCGKEKQTTFQVGDKVETYWFQFTVDQVKTTDRWMDYRPRRASAWRCAISPWTAPSPRRCP